MGGACCLGSKVHLLYLFPMVLVPMAHSSPMADITETCKWHQVRTQKDVELTWTRILDLWRQKKVLIRFLWQLMQLHVIKTFSWNVWKYKNGITGLDLHRSPRYSQTSPGFPFRVHCQGHASPPWCRRCHSSTSCTHRRCWAAAPKKFRQFRVAQRHSVLKRAKSLKAEILWVGDEQLL